MKKIIDLSGQDGNAYCLMGFATSISKQLGKSNKEIDAIMSDMKSSDYNHLVEVFEKHFKHFVTLINKP